MSYYPDDDPDVVLPWFLRKKTWIIASILFSLVVLGLGFYTFIGMTKVPEVSGGVTISADPDTRIYMGENWIATTQVTITWQELFGDESHNPMAVELSGTATPLTPDLVSGSGAVALDSQSLGGGGFGVNDLMVSSSGMRYLNRRADGELDEVMAIVIDWNRVNRPGRRYLLPVRVCKGEGESTVFFQQTGSGSSSGGGGPGFLRMFGKSTIDVKKSYSFSAGSPPAQFSKEIKEKGLWEPGKGK
jgi:hypothetical protein